MLRHFRALSGCLLIAAAAAACLTLPSAAQAHPHYLHVQRAKVLLVPAHLRPGYTERAHAALLFPVDLGMGPVFPFSALALR